MMLISSQMIILLMMTFMMTNHPMTLGFILMFLSILFSITMFFLSSSPWMSFILMMVFLSGSMVIFIYMTSVSSNEVVSLELTSAPFFAILMVMLMFYSNKFMSFHSMKNLSNLNNNTTSNHMEMIFKTYNPSLNFFTLFIIIYLLLVMIAAVKIATSSKTPLRM